MQVSSVESIVRALNGAGVKYLIVGGLAVNAHGFARLTMDVDLVIGLEPGNIIAGLRAMQTIGYQPSIPVTPEQFADAPTRETWRRDKQMLVLKLWSDAHRRTPVDVFVYEPFDFAGELQRAKWESVSPNERAPFISYGTLLAMKKEAGREKDLLDIMALQKLAAHR